MVSYLAGFHQEDGCEVHVACPKCMMPNISEHFRGIARVHGLPYSSRNTIAGACIAVSDAIRRISPRIIHTHARRPMVYTCLVNRSIPHIRTYHMEENERIPKTWLENTLVKARVDGWVATWQGIIDRDLAEIAGSEKPVRVIYNGVPAIQAQREKDTSGVLRLLFIGRLSHQKGLDILLEGLSFLDTRGRSKVRLLVVGDGELKESLLQRVNDLDLTSVVSFEGFQRDLAFYYQNSDIFVMPSRYEGLPLSFIEALSCGTPVIASSVGAVSTIIQDGVNGWLMGENTPKKWFEFVEHMIHCGVHEDVGKKARQTYEDCFRVEEMCKNYLELYYEIAGC